MPANQRSTVLKLPNPDFPVKQEEIFPQRHAAKKQKKTVGMPASPTDLGQIIEPVRGRATVLMFNLGSVPVFIAANYFCRLKHIVVLSASGYLNLRVVCRRVSTTRVAADRKSSLAHQSLRQNKSGSCLALILQSFHSVEFVKKLVKLHQLRVSEEIWMALNTEVLRAYEGDTGKWRPTSLELESVVIQQVDGALMLLHSWSACSGQSPIGPQSQPSSDNNYARRPTCSHWPARTAEEQCKLLIQDTDGLLADILA
ncbi:hypothetical protein PR048_013736 [Dryococelus australis]|uniref:Uncharacterized protein n=1 Tax=Dryococelus australis TaxID=614101 RepID=A0ABQ9HSZ9_9NEOP|nr:hypothetical protein PR048_013736 [Dryococelus australis]